MKEASEAANRRVGIEVTKSMSSSVCLDSDGSLVDSFQTETSTQKETVVHLGNFVSELKNRIGGSYKSSKR